MEEMLDTYDRQGRFLGVRSRSYCHSEGVSCYHKCVWIWITDGKGRFLVQKRSMQKRFMPGLWDMPSAGHIGSGECAINACVRETEEELGIRFAKERFCFKGEICSESLHEFGMVYLLVSDLSEGEVKLDMQEVEQIKWLDYEGFKSLLYSADFVPHDAEYKDFVAALLAEYSA